MQITWQIKHITKEEEVGNNKRRLCTVVIAEVDVKSPESAAIKVRGSELNDIVQWLSVWDTATIFRSIAHSEYEDKHYNEVTARAIKDIKTSEVNDGWSI